jgi:hypothetical protein
MAAIFAPPAPSPATPTRDLKRMAGYLRGQSARHAADRLEHLDWTIKHGKLEDRSAWASRLHDLIHIDGIVEGVRLRKTNPWWFGLLELVRNGWVLLPLVLTWYGISTAVTAYYNFLSRPGNEKLYENTSFVFLWQGGFIDKNQPGDVGELVKVHGVKLADLALADFGLLFILLLLTVAVVAISNLLNARREKQAEELREELTSLLFDSSRQLAAGIGSQDISVNLRQLVGEMQLVREQFAAVVQQWQQDRQAMQDMRTALSTAAGEMRGAADSLKQTGQDFTQTNAELRRLSDRMATSAGNMAGSAVALATTVNDLRTDQQQLTTEDKRLADGQQALLGMEQTLVAEQQNAVAAQVSLKTEVVQAINVMTQRLATISGPVGTLGALKDETQQLVGHFANLTQSQREYVETLKLLSNEQGRMVREMAQLAQPTGQAISNLEHVMRGVWGAANQTVLMLATIPDKLKDHMDAALRQRQAGQLPQAAVAAQGGQAPPLGQAVQPQNQIPWGRPNG